MADVVMPRLSDTMEEGTILQWLKRDGDQVERGEELVEIETDKAAMVYESDLQGTLEIVVGEGATLTVGEVIARIGTVLAGGSDSTPANGSATAAGGAATPATGDNARASNVEADVSAPSTDSATASPASSDDTGGERVKASPLAKRIARENHIDLHDVTGSGPGGRIVKADVLDPAPPNANTPQPAAGVSTAKGDTTTVELSRTQQTIARRMAESKATIPDFSIQMDVDMEDCVALRTELKRLSHPDAPADPAASPAPAVVPTYNDMVVKACALALREHPRVNGSYRDGRLQLHSRVNVGVAVASQDALLVPTVFDAEEKSLGEIARETRVLAEHVRSGEITPPELGGGTFTVSNLGMFGVSSFTAIVNSPQAAILSVGALAPRAVAKDGSSEIAVRHVMTLTLVCDHRILYGADAAQFLARVRELLEQPAALTL